MRKLLILGAPGCGVHYVGKLLHAMGFPMDSGLGIAGYHDSILKLMDCKDKLGFGREIRNEFLDGFWDGEQASGFLEKGKEGWADTRTVIFLERWLSIFPDLSCIFVTRKPSHAYESFCDRVTPLHPSYQFTDCWLRAHAKLNLVQNVQGYAIWDCDRVSADPEFALEFMRTRAETNDFGGFKPVERKEFMKNIELFQRIAWHASRSDRFLSREASNMWQSVKGRVHLK